MTRKELEEKFDKCLDLIDKCNKDRQECDPDMDRRIQAYATVALACAVKIISSKNNPTIGIGQIKEGLFCKKCSGKTTNIFCYNEEGKRQWKCTGCHSSMLLE